MLTALNETLIATFGPMGPVFAVLALGIVLIAFTLPTILKKQKDPYAKIRAQGGAAAKGAAPGQILRRGDRADKLEKFASFLEPQNESDMSAAKLKMMRAGYHAKNSVRMFHFSQFALGILFLVLGLLYTLLLSRNGEVGTSAMIMYTIAPGAAGYYLPQYWVQRRLQTRQGQIVQGFPDALDLMLVCIEAGQSLDQSINRIAKESRAGCPPLAEEFDMVAHEIKAGKDRVSVLKDMSERVGIADVASFVTTLVQSATFGTSIAEALRVYSAEMRDKRVMRAEEKANVLPTKLTLGTMMFTLPPLMIILIGPSVYGISKNLAGYTN